MYIIFWIGIPSKDFDPDLRKILYRDKENGVIGGVAKGLSNYLKIDANIIRVSFCEFIFWWRRIIILFFIVAFY